METQEYLYIIQLKDVTKVDNKNKNGKKQIQI